MLYFVVPSLLPAATHGEARSDQSVTKEYLCQAAKMSLELYCLPLGPPTRTVLLVAKALDVPLELKIVDVFSGEQFNEEFMKMNPQHTVPLLVDGDLCLSESCAISIYLAEQYGKDGALYPNDPKKRAVINQRLFFADTVLWPRVIQTYIFPVLFLNSGINDLMMDKLDDAFNILNTYLDGHDWVANDELSIADFALVSRVSQAQAAGYNVSKHENVALWMEKCKETMDDYEDLEQSNVEKFAEIYNEKLSKIEA